MAASRDGGQSRCPGEARTGEGLQGEDAVGELDGAGLIVLDRAECLRMLAEGGVGRIAINFGALPRILPVRFVLDVEEVIMCVGMGTTLERATRDVVVAFEADGLVPASGSEWSVSLVGVARHVPDGSESARAEALALPRWGLERSHCFVSVSTDHVSGRRTPDWR